MASPRTRNDHNESWRLSYAHPLLRPSFGGTLITNQSWKTKMHTEANQTNHQYLEVDNGSSQLAYSTPDSHYNFFFELSFFLTSRICAPQEELLGRI